MSTQHSYSLPSFGATSENWHQCWCLHSPGPYPTVCQLPSFCSVETVHFALHYWVEIMDLCGGIPEEFKSSLPPTHTHKLTFLSAGHVPGNVIWRKLCLQYPHQPSFPSLASELFSKQKSCHSETASASVSVAVRGLCLLCSFVLIFLRRRAEAHVLWSAGVAAIQASAVALSHHSPLCSATA